MGSVMIIFDPCSVHIDIVVRCRNISNVDSSSRSTNLVLLLSKILRSVTALKS